MTSISGGSGVGAPNFAARPAGAKPGDATKTSFDDLLADFQKAASETPTERAAADVLKKHGVTKEQLAKLPPAQRDAILKEIEEAVKKVAKLEAQKTVRPGDIA